MHEIFRRLIFLIVCTSFLPLFAETVLLAKDSAADARYHAINEQYDAAYKQHDNQLAQKLAYQMISLNPKDARGYKNLCRAEDELHNFKAALAAINMALKFNKDNPKCLCARGKVYAESDQDSLAKRDYEKAITTDRESADFYTGAAAALEHLDDFEGALVAIKKALILEPESGKIQNIAGRVLGRLNRPQEAEPYLKKAVLLSPGATEPLRHLAVVHAQLKRPDAVLVDTTSAIKMGSIRGMHLVELYRIRAEALTTLGRLPEAREDYDRCIKISPLQRSLFQARAKVNQKLGDLKAAGQDLARVKSLDTSEQPFNGF